MKKKVIEVTQKNLEETVKVAEENLAILSENLTLSDESFALSRKNAEVQAAFYLKSKQYRLLCEVIEAKFGLDSLDGFLDPPHPQISTTSGFILFLT